MLSSRQLASSGLADHGRFRPEIALTRLALAELLLGQYPDERSSATDHLGFAIAELMEMKMAPPWNAHSDAVQR